MQWPEVWHGRSPGPRLARAALTPLSWLYGGGWQLYLGIYRLGLKKPREPHRPVVCVGNLVAGGAGKSPVALLVARHVLALGRRAVLGCSGYGSPASKGARWAPEGELDASQWGDEPAMLRWLEPSLPLVVGRDRVQAAALVAQRHPDAVLVMDDGFQHLPLRQHLSILLEEPGPNGRCLPAGPYREPPGNASRADLVLPGEFRVEREPSEIRRPGRGPLPVEAMRGARVQALCALARPARFFESIERLGSELALTRAMPDHDPLDAGNLFEGLDPGLPLVVTAKDWVKLRRRGDIGRWDVHVLMQEVRIEPEDAFRAWLSRKLDGISNQPAPR